MEFTPNTSEENKDLARKILELIVLIDLVPDDKFKAAFQSLVDEMIGFIPSESANFLRIYIEKLLSLKVVEIVEDKVN